MWVVKVIKFYCVYLFFLSGSQLQWHARYLREVGMLEAERVRERWKRTFLRLDASFNLDMFTTSLSDSER